MTEFKVGDRIKFKEKYMQNTIYEVLKIDKENIFIDSYQTCWTANLFELVERKVGEHWFKPHELHIHENVLSPTKHQFDKNISEKIEFPKTEYLVKIKSSWFDVKYMKEGRFYCGENDNGITYELIIKEVINE